MDLLTVLMGGSFVAAGWFLFCDYSRFLSSTYSTRARVVSFEQGLQSKICPSPGMSGSIVQEKLVPHPLNHTIYPVIEYFWGRDPVRFTALGCSQDAFFIGDQVNLFVSRSRRRRGRATRSTIAVLLLVTALLSILLVASVASNDRLSLEHIVFGSMTLTVCVFLLVLYVRQLDALQAAMGQDGPQRRNSVILQEPAAPCKWLFLLKSRYQKRKVFLTKMAGSGFVLFGLIVFGWGIGAL